MLRSPFDILKEQFVFLSKYLKIYFSIFPILQLIHFNISIRRRNGRNNISLVKLLYRTIYLRFPPFTSDRYIIKLLFSTIYIYIYT